MVRRARASRAQSRLRRTPESSSQEENSAQTCRIPGVRIAYIGQQTVAAEEIRIYWRVRGATLAVHSIGAATTTSELDAILHRADIVFLATDCIDRETERRVETCCDRLETPMIALDEGSLSAVEQALRTCYPLAHL